MVIISANTDDAEREFLGIGADLIFLMIIIILCSEIL